MRCTTKILLFLALVLSHGCTFEKGTDYQGNDIPPVTALQVANASECCALCGAHNACTVWTLQPGIGCYLKTSAAGKRTMAGATSGSTGGPAPPPAPPECRDAVDCSLGGECKEGTCVCDAAWKGPHCVQLDLTPASPTPLCDNGGDQSWGGNAVYDASDGKWHLFYAEFLHDCPLGSWGTNSVVSHATSSSPQGPYERRETVLPAFHHNPSVAYDASTGTFVLLAIGAGNASAADIQNCTKADRSGLVGDPAQAGIITLSHARSANGPWTTLPEPVLPRLDGWERGFFTNPRCVLPLPPHPPCTALMLQRPICTPASSSSTTARRSWLIGVASLLRWQLRQGVGRTTSASPPRPHGRALTQRPRTHPYSRTCRRTRVSSVMSAATFIC